MDTVLFSDHGILVFAMTTGAIASMLMLAVLGLATTYRTRSDIEHQWLPVNFRAYLINRQLGTGDAELNEWKLLQNQFHAQCVRALTAAKLFLMLSLATASRVIEQAARANWRRWTPTGNNIFRVRG